MLAVGGLKAAAKRTAFGDISNTAKTLSTAHDDSAIAGKSISLDVVKPLATQERSAAFLRPAQRPLNIAAAKGAVNSSLALTASESMLPPKAPVESRQQPPQPPTNKQTSLKRETTIYKDATDDEHQRQIFPARLDSAPTAQIHHNAEPRQIKSQLQLDQPSLRRTHSKYIDAEPLENTVPSDRAYQNSADKHTVDSSTEGHEHYLRMMNQKSEQSAQEGVKSTHDTVDQGHRQLPVPPLASEPEEYWEEEEEEIYDDQGYTTAHSYRSRGDNTTGGATTVLFPKVTNKVKKEIAAAKEIVETARTAEEIEDELWDTSMVAEYGDEIFTYMRELEVRSDTFILSFLP